MVTDTNAAVGFVAEFLRTHPSPSGHVYRHVEDSVFPVEVVPIGDVEPFARGNGVPGLHRDRAYSILEDIGKGIPLHPVNVYRKNGAASKPSFELYHGLHRYHLSIALGFTHIPVAINSAGTEDAL